MNAQNKNRYSSTKFAVLSNSGSISTAKRYYFIWIITGTLLFCMTVALFSYKLITLTYFNDEKPQSFNISTPNVTLYQRRNSKLKLYNPDPLLEALKKKSQKDRNKFRDDESQIQLETIPVIFVEQMLQYDFENLQDFINLNLLLHYENLINQFKPKRLKMIFNEYQLKLLLLKNSRGFVDFLASLKSNKFKFYALLIKHQKYNLELKYFEGFFALTEELNHWYNYLHRLPSFLSTYEQQKLRENLENCTEKNFQKFTQETQKHLFYFAYPFKITEKKLHEINEIINMWSKPTTIEFYNCSVILYKKVLLLNDINEEIQRLNASCLEYIYAFANHIIYLDNDLEFFGVNLAIVAPKWVFLKKIKINLNGIKGKEFTNETASFNKSGMPGNPGGNAGDFIGIGNLHEKFLIISASGGRGGNGQNGAKGPDGMHYTRPGPPVSTPACMSKINTYNNSFGQTITHYKIFNPFGCGRSGTDGGVGGIGGAGGIISLINDSIKITRGLNGITGTPGKGGAGGVGGQNGCFYEVLDVDDETLQPITKVKCPRGNTLPSGEYGKDNYNTQRQIFLAKKENLTVHNTLNNFFRLAGKDFVKNNEKNFISFWKNLNQLNLHSKVFVRDLITEYKLLEVFNKIELYDIFKEKILKYKQNNPDDSQQILEYLVSTVLGRIMVLKENVNFFFVDFKNFLNVVERSIKATDELTFELQSISYFKKKVRTKIEEIKMNLNQLKRSSTALTSNINSPGKSKKNFLSRNNSKKYFLNELNKKILDIVNTTADVLGAILDSVLDDPKRIRFNNLLKLYQGNASVLAQRTFYTNNSKISNKSTLTNTEILLSNTLENLRNNNSQEIKRNLSNLKDGLSELKESDMLSNQIKDLLETLADEMEHFEALYIFLEWEELEILFTKSLDNLKLNSTLVLKEDEEVNFLKSQLVDAVTTLQCKLAAHSAGLNLHYLKNIPACFQLIHNKTIANIITDHRSLLQNIACEDIDSLCKNHFEAVFEKHSALGEFYFWSNDAIRDKLENLFSGAEISLKSDIINRYVFDKNFIQFRSLKLEFETKTMSHNHLQEILSSFKIEMVHSGYSYYNWKGETYVFVSEKVSLEYSFKVQDNGEPEVYNTLYKKCQDGEIKLSPFTTWTLRLLPIKGTINFSKLKPFVNTVNLRLIGTGTYIS